MNDTSITNLLFTALPFTALVISGMFAPSQTVSKLLLSKFQHFAAGVVISAVALELLPTMLKAGSLPGITLGYCFGVMTMLAVDHYGERMGSQVPIAIDLFIDGLLLAIGFAAGEKGGLLLMIGLTLETVSLGLVTAPPMTARGEPRSRVLITLTMLGLAIVAGASCGMLLPEETGFWFAGILGFGVAALLFLVVEELLSEAHETEDTPFATALFFIGFLIPLILGQIAS